MLTAICHRKNCLECGNGGLGRNHTDKTLSAITIGHLGKTKSWHFQVREVMVLSHQREAV